MIRQQKSSGIGLNKNFYNRPKTIALYVHIEIDDKNSEV